MNLARHPTILATAFLSCLYLYLGTRAQVPEPLYRIPDTVTHGGAYAVLAALAGRSAALLGATLPGAWGWAYAVAHGAALELLQRRIPTRSAEGKDLAADAIGAALGVSCAALLSRR